MEAVLVSYRLGGTDGVSVEAEKWEWALRVLGFTTRRIAGHICDEPRPDDVVLPGIAIDAPDGAADPGPLATALAGADLVVAENICSLPINVHASSAASDALARSTGAVSRSTTTTCRGSGPSSHPSVASHPTSPARSTSS